MEGDNGKKRCRENALSFDINIDVVKKFVNDESLIQKIHALTEERDQAIKERDEAIKERDEAIQMCEQAEEDAAIIERKHEDAIKKRDDAIREHEEYVEQLENDVEDLERERDKAIKERDINDKEAREYADQLFDELNEKRDMRARISALEGSMHQLDTMSTVQLLEIADKASNAIQNVLTVLAQKSAT